MKHATNKFFRSLLLSCLVFLSSSPLSYAEQALKKAVVQKTTPASLSIVPASINYVITMVSALGDATLGELVTSIKATDRGYAVSSKTVARGMAALIMRGNVQESCEFSTDKGRVVSNHYAGGTKDLTGYNVDYDWLSKKIKFVNAKDSTSNKKENNKLLDMPHGYIVDNCNFPFAAAFSKGISEFDPTTATQAIYVIDGNKKRIRGYKAKQSTRESIETHFGSFDTLKIVLEREFNPERTFTFWLSPKHGYIPIKMEEKRKSRTITMLANKFNTEQ